MSIIKILTQNQVSKALSDKEKLAGENVMRQCLAVKPGETVVVITDPAKEAEATVFFESAKKFTGQVELVSFTGMTENAQEPPPEIAEKLFSCSVAFLVTTFSLSHTEARKQACAKGARIASLPGITLEMLTRTLSQDYSRIAETSRTLADQLSRGSRVEITSPAGTELRLQIAGRQAIADTGFIIRPADFGNLPAGEAFLAPLEAKTEGIVVFDGAFAGLELDAPIKLDIRQGKAVNLSGGKAADQLVRLLDELPENAKIIGELGIGTNPKARLCPQILEAEKVYGTCHLALGNNAGFGGTNQVSFHSDGLIKNPHLSIDGKTILKQRKVIIS